MRRHGKPHGFTLLEVVVSLAVLGVAVAVILQIFSGGLKNIHRIDMAHRAMNHAENVMNGILSDRDLREPTRLSGELDEDFAYTAEVDYWEEPDSEMTLEVARPRVELLSVVVDVHFKHDERGKLYRTICLKTVPAEPGTGLQTTDDVIRQLFGGR